MKTTKANRVANDYYPTPAVIIDRLLNILSSVIQESDILFDPAAGHGAIVDRCQLKYQSFGNDPYPSLDYQPKHQLDATLPSSWEIFGKVDWTITNTPYDSHLMLPMLTNAIEYSRSGVAALVRVTWLEPCSDRAEFLKSTADMLRYWIPINPRPKFRTDISGTDNTTVAWIVWDKAWSWQAFGIDCPFKFITGWKK